MSGSNKIDIAELDAGNAASVDFPNPNDLTKFNVSVTPDTGFWKGATYKFSFVIPAHYVSAIQSGIDFSCAVNVCNTALLYITQKMNIIFYIENIFKI